MVGGFSVTGPEHAITASDGVADLADEVSAIVNEYELEPALA